MPNVNVVGDVAGGTDKGNPNPGKGKGGVGDSGIPGTTRGQGGRVPSQGGKGPRVNMPGRRARPTSVRRIGTR